MRVSLWQLITAPVYLDDLLGLELPDWHEILRLHTTMFLNEPMDRGIPCCKGWNIPKLHGSCMVPPELPATKKNGSIVGPKQPVEWQLSFLTLACKLPGSGDRRCGSFYEMPEHYICLHVEMQRVQPLLDPWSASKSMRMSTKTGWQNPNKHTKCSERVWFSVICVMEWAKDKRVCNDRTNTSQTITHVSWCRLRCKH